MAKQVTFLNISINSMVIESLAGAYAGLTETDIILYFVEALPEGLKFSLSAPEGKNATCVALTLPHDGSTTESICCTFWGDETFDALFEAFLVFRFFEAHRDGFYKAKQRIAAYQKEMAANLKRFLEEGNSPIKTRLVE